MIVLVTDHFTSESLVRLKAALNCEVVRTELFPTPEELYSANAMLIRSRTEISPQLLSKTKNLKVVVTATSGYDHIDPKACQELGVTVMNTPDANTNAAAEHTLMLMLAALKNLTDVYAVVKRLGWKESLRPGGELRGRTVGIIGLGRVGSQVARLAQAFGANVIAHDPYQTDEQFEKLGLSRSSIMEVMVASQILTFHVPLTKETRHMISAQTLAQLSSGTILINTSRGSVFDEGALVQSLESGHIAAAALDVFENEPLGRESRLRKMKNVILTPHVGAMTHEAFSRASEQAVDQLISFMKTGKATNVVS